MSKASFLQREIILELLPAAEVFLVQLVAGQLAPSVTWIVIVTEIDMELLELLTINRPSCAIMEGILLVESAYLLFHMNDTLKTLC